jgi:hypothetical protein
LETSGQRGLSQEKTNFAYMHIGLRLEYLFGHIGLSEVGIGIFKKYGLRIKILFSNLAYL